MAIDVNFGESEVGLASAVVVFWRLAQEVDDDVLRDVCGEGRWLYS